MKPILIFDLDDTILSINSFQYWVRYMLTGHFGGLNVPQRLALFLRTSQILLQRKLLRRRSHYHAKRLLQALWTQALEKDPARAAMHNLNAFLQAYVRPNLRNVMAVVAEGHVDALLATSAAGEYAQGLGRALGFTHVLATPLCTQPDNLENCGERKRDRVLAMLDAQRWHNRRRIFFTDHEDDLPLIHQCHRIFWFGSDDDAADIQASSPWVEVIACRNMPGAKIMQLVRQEERQASSGKSPAVLQYG